MQLDEAQAAADQARLAFGKLGNWPQVIVMPIERFMTIGIVVVGAYMALSDTTGYQVGALFASAQALLCHDSGPMHVAAAVGTPVVALFSSQNATIWRPLGPGHTVLQTELPCACLGAEAPSPADILASGQLPRVLATAGTDADIVLLDCPPVCAFADASVLATRVDGVVIVVGAGVVKRDLARQARAQLEAVRANVLGIVVTNAPFSERAFASYYDGAPTTT